MHPRSRYAQHEPDFAALAAKHPGLAEFATLRPDGRFRLGIMPLKVMATVTVPASTLTSYIVCLVAVASFLRLIPVPKRAPTLPTLLCPCRSASLDFANPDALRQLTRALLAEDFGVADWWIPDGQLIPPVPNRLNYIHWIEDLLRLSSPPGAQYQQPSSGVTVAIDVVCREVLTLSLR